MRKWIIPIEHAAIIVTAPSILSARKVALEAIQAQVGDDVFVLEGIGEPTEILDKPVLIEYLNEEFQTLD